MVAADVSDCLAILGQRGKIDRQLRLGVPEVDLAGRNAQFARQQAQERLGSHALAATRFADQGEYFSRRYAEVDAIDDGNVLAIGIEHDPEIANVQQFAVFHAGPLFRVGISGIAHTVADEVEGEHGENDDQPGDQQPRHVGDRSNVLRRIQEYAPALDRFAQAEPEETE